MTAGLTKADKERWVEEMPVLAEIRRRFHPDCGVFVRETHFGKLYKRVKDGNAFYTLVKK